MKRIAATLLLVAGGPAMAHGGEDHAPNFNWTLDPWLTVPLALLLAIYLAGVSRLRRRSNAQRPGTLLFVGGWAVLTLALVSPLHSGGERSFTLHMIEHELIMLVATLLLAASRAGGTLAWGLPRPLRLPLRDPSAVPLKRLWHRLTEPVTATLVQAVVMWAWHAPGAFDWALRSDFAHALQHLSFIAASLLFWSAMLNPRRAGFGASAACLFVTSLVGGALGALMTFSAGPWYSAYAAMGMSGIGLDPVTDQQLAGLLMWIPGGLFHAGAALAFLYRWLKAAESAHAIAAR